jgi:hypothetical protein
MSELAFEMGRKAGLKAASEWHLDVAKHDQGGMDYSSAVGIPISNWDELDTSVRTHEWCAREILGLALKDSKDEGDSK